MLSAQALFDIGAQRSDPFLLLSALALFDISAQRSDLILDRRLALQHLHQRLKFFMTSLKLHRKFHDLPNVSLIVYSLCLLP